ncbi:hypothetical protein FRC03_007012 [Tulasnella sp. 419]|nr:hypothetical protein FRC03_007012 [Tulasnella sp. 419]
MLVTLRQSVALVSFATHVFSQNLNDRTLQLVRARMNANSTASWEMGTRAQTLIEIDYKRVSVYSSTYLSPTPPSSASLEPVISIARDAVNSRTNDQLVRDGSAADPCSLGVAVLLGNWTNAPGANFVPAANDQLQLILDPSRTPRSPEGAISHRTEYAQLWSDFVYMVPPFLAYYGAVTSNKTLIAESVRQIELYRDALRSGESGPEENLWKHIVMKAPNGFNDLGYWSTGMGWAASGMLRVLGTIQNSPFSKDFKDEQSQLSMWIQEIQEGMFNFLPESGLFTNYVDQPNTFTDAASSAAIAASVYRLVTLTGDGTNNIQNAEKIRNAIYENNGQTHFDPDGWLIPVTNPYNYGEEGRYSPEGQAFVLQMDNAWKEWKAAGGKSNGSCPRAKRSHMAHWNRFGPWIWLGVIMTLIEYAVRL